MGYDSAMTTKGETEILISFSTLHYLFCGNLHCNTLNTGNFWSQLESQIWLEKVKSEEREKRNLSDVL